jgi:hypothetical protein
MGSMVAMYEGCPRPIVAYGGAGECWWGITRVHKHSNRVSTDLHPANDKNKPRRISSALQSRKGTTMNSNIHVRKEEWVRVSPRSGTRVGMVLHKMTNSEKPRAPGAHDRNQATPPTK